MAKLIILLIIIYVLQCVSSSHRVLLSKESSQSLCDDPRRLKSKPVTVLRKMFNVCAPKLFCILWCNKGIFVSPEHKGSSMSCQVMETVFLRNESLCDDPRRLKSKPVTVLRKMFNVCAPKLFCILWCNKGI